MPFWPLGNKNIATILKAGGKMSLSHAIFAAGCFWGVQAAFDAVPGVTSTIVGYTGGTTANPSYETVCFEDTNHAEAVKVTFDDSHISYRQLLDIFFASHNPTTRNRQGADIGPQYRSAIFYLDEAQKEAALQKIKELNASGAFSNPIVTEVTAATEFYPAEEYHQKYLAKKGQRSCGFFSKSTDKKWQDRLTPEQYKVLRQKATEKPFSGKYLYTKDDGTYACAACGNPIFSSTAKFDSGSGWPSFSQAIPGQVKLSPDYSYGMIRTEVTCARCGSHLGHLFEDSSTQSKMRYCINSSAMDFEKQ